MNPSNTHAGPGRPPTTADPTRFGLQIAVKTNNHFALAMHEQLVRGKVGENLFWSPFSVTSALLLAAEGARGDTAEEMGRALSLPPSLHAVGERPWNLLPLHAGLAELSAALQPQPKEDSDALQVQIAEVRRELEAVQNKYKQMAKGLTSREFLEALTADGDFLPFGGLTWPDRLRRRLHNLLDEVDQYEIHVANRLWCEQSYELNPEFIEVVEAHYGTGCVVPASFKTAPETEIARIDAWVEEQTEHRICSLLPPGSVSDLTGLILTNAIYFKGEWTQPFKLSQSKLRPFTLAKGNSLPVHMMTGRLKNVRYAAFEGDGKFFFTPREVDLKAPDPEGPGPKGWAIVELPYKGAAISMILIAPNRHDGMPNLEAKLAAGQFETWLDRLEQREVDVIMPRFKLETSHSMKDPLQALGMVRAFEPPNVETGAQFDGMTSSSTPEDRLFLSEVFHKAFVDVDEKGTEAAAATAATVSIMGIPKTITYVPTFRADRPFLFAIRHVRSGAILFMGRVMRPE